MKSIKLKNEGSPLVAQNEVRADIFSGSLAVNSFNYINSKTFLIIFSPSSTDFLHNH
jgi:hypothetical protein